MTKDDTITQKVENMYKKYPYPSPSTDAAQTNELLNLLRIFEMESKIKLEEKNILDAGSGSGHRITNVAQFFKKCNFLGIDISEKSLEIANELKNKKNTKNIQFQKHNIMTGVENLGKFDIVLCMGVLHHLSNPSKGLQMLTKTLKDDGIIFLYLYGKLGGHKRMLNKEMISILLGKEKSNYDLGIELVRDLELNKFDYGWNLNFKNKKEEDTLIVDSLLHTNEFLYDFNDIDKLFKKTNLYGYSIFGITESTQGLLFDSSIKTEKKLSIPQTNVSQKLKSNLSLSFYESLNLKEKFRIIDLLYEPNGYTLVGFTKYAYDKLSNDRIKRNFIVIN
ncbi:methyltransferase [Nitrosopumilus zosterae]|uniref:Methyltransferase n=1 Tax=Nitrosopumilus zosterae TaxID=718286 RepID=A0A2S2KUC3_9ARCH|nr:class I SAM-dependent methyltransferase [Nitrosopumilus zosterae]BDQ31807.1 class I SAM-dependent methyltransferase [Nitrosopumilus zosterae]GBH35157.1 methyltransferase [Nitrosopumilus zosterae]